MKMRTAIFSIIVTALTTVAPISTTAAGGSTLSVTPDAGTLSVGSTLNINIVENGKNIREVQTTLNYDAGRFSCHGVGPGVFAVEYTAFCGAGKVTIHRGVPDGQPALNGPQVVGSVSFQTLSAGSASLGFGPSRVVSGGANTLTSSSGGNYTLVDDTPPPTSGGSTGGSGQGTSSTYIVYGTPVVYGPRSDSSKPSAVTNNNARTALPASNQPAVLSEQSKDSQRDASAGDQTTTTTQNKPANASWLGRVLVVLFALTAIAGGIFASRRYRSEQAEKAAIAAAALLAAQRKAQAKKTAKKKSTPKKKTVKK